jgi:hypothetical protein
VATSPHLFRKQKWVPVGIAASLCAAPSLKIQRAVTLRPDDGKYWKLSPWPSSPEPVLLIGELQLRDLRGVVLDIVLTAHIMDLPSEAIAGLPEQGLDLRGQGLEVGSRKALGRVAAGAMHCNRCKYPVKLGRLDAPLPERVFDGENLAVLDCLQNCRPGQPGCCCRRREGIEHARTPLLKTKAIVRPDCRRFM